MNTPTLQQRAYAIWGVTINTQPRPDGGLDIDTITDSSVSLSRYHRLDKTGRVACHVSCQEHQIAITPSARRIR